MTITGPVACRLFGMHVLTHVVPGVDPDTQRGLAAEAFPGPVEVAVTHRTFDV